MKRTTTPAIQSQHQAQPIRPNPDVLPCWLAGSDLVYISPLPRRPMRQFYLVGWLARNYAAEVVEVAAPRAHHTHAQDPQLPPAALAASSSKRVCLRTCSSHAHSQALVHQPRCIFGQMANRSVHGGELRSTECPIPAAHYMHALQQIRLRREQGLTS